MTETSAHQCAAAAGMPDAGDGQIFHTRRHTGPLKKLSGYKLWDIIHSNCGCYSLREREQALEQLLRRRPS